MKQMIDNRKQGFTLIEVIVSVAVFTLISLGIIALVSAILTSSNRQNNLLVNNDQTRKNVFVAIKELRNAKQSANGGYALNTAGTQQLIFYSDSGTMIDRINYFVQNGILKKGITHPSGNPIIYDLTTESVTVVQNDLANGVNPIFYYYDDNYNGVTDVPLVQPVNVTQVKFVKMNIMVYKKVGVTNVNSYSVTAGGAIRNLKTNLGN